MAEEAEAEGGALVAELRGDVITTRKLARQAFNAGDYVKAVRLYTDGVELLKDEREAPLGPRENTWLAKLLVRRACAYRYLGNLYQSIADAEEALEARPDLQKAFLIKGSSLLDTEHFAEACESFRAGLRHHPNDEELRAGFAKAIECVRKNRHRHAAKYDHFLEAEAETSLAVHDLEDIKKDMEYLGAVVDFNDLYKDELRFWNEIMPDEKRFDRSREHEKILKFFAQNSSDLFIAFATCLGDCKSSAAHNEASLRNGNQARRMSHRGGANLNLSGADENRVERLVTEFNGGVPAPSERIVPIGLWSRMTEDQFWQLVVRSEILTEDFDEKHFREVWALITDATERGPPLRRAATARWWNGDEDLHEAKDANSDDEQDEEDEDEDGDQAKCKAGEYILFPKALEGIARLVLRRYQPTAKFEPREGSPYLRGSTTSSTLSMSERIFFAFDKHLISRTNRQASAASKKQLPGLEAAVANLKEMASHVQKSKRVLQVRQLYDSRLHQLYDHFKSPRAPGMRVAEFIRMARVIGFIDRYNRNQDLVVSTIVAVTRFVGDLQRLLGFDEFLDILTWMCELKTRDGVVPLHHRFEKFVVNEVLRPAQAKTDLGNLFT